MKNMAYVGAVAAIIGLDMSIIQNLINETFEKKKKINSCQYQGSGFRF